MLIKSYKIKNLIAKLLKSKPNLVGVRIGGGRGEDVNILLTLFGCNIKVRHM